MTLHALDLPNLRQKPTQALLATTLAGLERPPATFLTPLAPPLDQGTVHWLTRLIASDLSYLDDGDTLLDHASALLAANCGRQAMPAMTRTFDIAGHQFALHEPTLTGDSLGLKTWGTSFLLSRLLPKILSSLVTGGCIKTALELGAGTGLVGIAAQKLLDIQVTLTDYLDDINENLASNAERNNVTCRTCWLDWREPDKSLVADETFDLVLASDFMYSSEHADLVAKMLTRFVRQAIQ